jgi:hypothetical protein
VAEGGDARRAGDVTQGGERMLPRNQRQEALSRAYVRAVAARAGVTCVDATQDFGIDLFLRGVTAEDGRYTDTGPQLDIQLKSTTRAGLRGPEVIYDLDVRAYNLLHQAVVGSAPRILVLLVLPDDEAQWLTQTVEELSLRRCAYWRSLRGAEPTTAHTTVRVAIPHGNVFSVDAVRAMMDLLEQGGTL